MRQKLLSILLPILIGILGFGLGSVVTKIGLDKKNETKQEIAPTSTEATSTETEKPAEEGFESYTVKDGDTLFGISMKFDIPMDKLAEFNNITDPNQIKVGQVLKIPKPGSTISKEEIEIDLDKMKDIQALVDQGEQSWRLDPVEVVKATAPASFQFSALDNYSLKSKDLDNGKAVVSVKKTIDSEVKTFEVDLIQPVTKGENGIWAITAIKS
jgi:LysM repeat protein